MKQCKCKQCGKEFLASHKRKHCTRSCSEKYGRKKRYANKMHCIHCKAERSVTRVRLGVNCICQREGRLAPVSCLFCGFNVVISRHQVSRNGGKAYCSVVCYHNYRKTQTEWNRQLKRQQKNAVESGEIKCCEWCKSMFIGDRKTCSNEGCKMPRKPNKHPAKRVTCIQCGQEGIRPEGLRREVCSRECSNKYSLINSKEKEKKNIRENTQDGKRIKKMRRLHKHKRRALIRDAYVEKVDPYVVYDRAKWRCYYCEQEIRQYPNNPGINQDEATIDHVVPISKGGEHSYSNIVAACRDCNSRKSARDLDEFLEEIWARQGVGGGIFEI